MRNRAEARVRCGWWLAKVFLLLSAEVRAAEGLVDRFPVESKSIASLGYSPGVQQLEIEFRSGGIYQYQKVPEAVVAELLQAPSKGRYFSNFIRGRYPYRKAR